LNNKYIWKKLPHQQLGQSENICTVALNNPDSLSHFTRSTGNLAAEALRDQYEPLLKAINSGNWDDANDFVSNNEDAKSAKISKDGGTVLHEAVTAGRTEIVDEV
jgi:ankyrin repeat protein